MLKVFLSQRAQVIFGGFLQGGGVGGFVHGIQDEEAVECVTRAPGCKQYTHRGPGT